MTLTTIAQTADAALCRAMGANQNDEIPGIGPKWACDQFGQPGHNYYGCIHCTGNFMERFGDNNEHTGSN